MKLLGFGREGEKAYTIVSFSPPMPFLLQLKLLLLVAERLATVIRRQTLLRRHPQQFS